MTIFVSGSLVALLVLGAVAVLLAERIAKEEALDHAAERTGALARVIGPSLNGDALRRGDLRGTKVLRTAVDTRLADGSLTHVKVWGSDGTVLWADESELIGRRFDLPDQVRALVGTAGTVAEVSELDRAENVSERAEGEQLEVYAGTQDADGQPLLLESYHSSAVIARDFRSIIATYLPVSLAVLLMSQIAILPLALRLARAVDRGKDERTRMLRHSLLAADLERRRLAAQLHDEVIPDLAALSYRLPVATRPVPAEATETDGERRVTMSADFVGEIGQILKGEIAALRTLLGSTYPSDLTEVGWCAAVRHLAGRTLGPDTALEVDDLAGELPPVAQHLAYRIVREALLNVGKHARATVARVEVGRDRDTVTVRVTDDGVGVTAGRRSVRSDGTRLGVRLLQDTLEDLGGGLTVSDRTPRGAVLAARFPVDLPGSVGSGVVEDDQLAVRAPGDGAATAEVDGGQAGALAAPGVPKPAEASSRPWPSRWIRARHLVSR